ncbi:ABC transporter permease [Aeromicrobium sp. A1-2]|uniref:ABC transporter permease n=1 Tax=Aeromicrobium sp. A1-2 TaxID=2107713 RepID=UPI000E4F04A5|nr:ABC transporter permease [Aeromicrobium sp. A1-2]AXT86446.1 ABC transporter permease [Aeromicrobium sp. A1-2]
MGSLSTHTAPHYRTGIKAQVSRHLRRASASGVVGPLLVLAVLFVVYVVVRPAVVYLPQFNTMANGGAGLAIAAAGGAVVILIGGFDLSVGAVISLVNVIVATRITDSVGSELTMIGLAILIGAGAGLINGLLVTFLQIPSIVATLAMSFFGGGAALLVLAQPGGSVPSGFVSAFTGNVGNAIPASVILLLLISIVWLLIKRTGFGLGLYAVGGEVNAAVSNGVKVRQVQIMAYSLAGALYGVAAIFLTAQTSSGDPRIGQPMLLNVFAAIVIGGVLLGGGKGDLVGAIIGAYILYVVTDVLFALGVSSFYSAILNGVLLLMAVVVTALPSVRKWQWLQNRSRPPVSMVDEADAARGASR